MHNRLQRLRSRSPRRWRRLVVILGVGAILLGVNVPPAMAYASTQWHEYEINTPDYKAEYGHWDEVSLPSGITINAIHAALLPSGKLLIVAGSGNDQAQFDAGTFKTLLFDPATGQTKQIFTPEDFFCGGHAFLPNGNLLVAGGTLRYEVLDGKVTKPAGTMVVKNESPDFGTAFPKGTTFVSPDGKRYLSTAALTINPATKTPLPKINGVSPGVTVTASQATVWVEAEQEGPASLSEMPTKYSIPSLVGDAAHNIYGMAQKMTLDKQDYQGMRSSYEFNTKTEQYERVSDMNEPRWYPTLTGLPDGQVMAISGLDGSGQILNGQNEIFDPQTKTWTERPDLQQYFPTYPAIYQTAVPNQLFYSGSNSGYGLGSRGRQPGFWDLTDNSFHPVTGLRDPDLLETSGSAWVGPVQNQKMMVVGGGGVGQSNRSTGRIDTINLNDPSPQFKPGPSLPQGTRYPSVVTLPDDSTLITGGASEYRGNHASDNHTARIYHEDGTLSIAADPLVGRDYHSEALLMPDGRVITLGSNPLFSDAKDTQTAPFEQRIEIYTPPYLYQGNGEKATVTGAFFSSHPSTGSQDLRSRPVLTGGPDVLPRGSAAIFAATTPNGQPIVKARLIRPSAVTHVTNVEQRSVALGLVAVPGGVSLTAPADPTILPPGPYMLFVDTADGTPSVARWVMVP